ncbi:hypothetical protein [Novosphingobium sp.]|uniref:hypothetical protein n=1 Tax=Novosphingobium sp. TaxID=1874826 RepID=UPI002605EEFE|nr:hypothetical protein [Novosphingobium sp.]
MKQFQGPDGATHIVGDPDDDVIEFLEASFAIIGKTLDIEYTGESWCATITSRQNPDHKTFLAFTTNEPDYIDAKYTIYAAMLEAFPENLSIPDKTH